jgi:hypothetical protein
MNNILLTGLTTVDHGSLHQCNIDGASIPCRILHEPELEVIKNSVEVNEFVRSLNNRVSEYTETQVAQRFVHLQLVDARLYELLIRNLKAARFRVLVGQDYLQLKEL